MDNLVKFYKTFANNIGAVYLKGDCIFISAGALIEVHKLDRFLGAKA